MYKSIFVALVTAASTLGAGAAHAGVSWSIGINAPVVGAVVSNEPVYGPAYGPAYGPSYESSYAPVYAPAPVYVRPPVGYYPRREVFVRPLPIVYPRFYPGWNHDHGRWDGGHDRGHWDGRGHDRGHWDNHGSRH